MTVFGNIMYLWKRSRRLVFHVVLVTIFCFCQFYQPLALQKDLKDIPKEIVPNNQQRYFEVADFEYGVRYETPVPSNWIFKGTLQNVTEYFDFLKMSRGSFCRKVLSLGGTSCKSFVDGDKQICFDDYIRPRYNDCLVYSFGVGFDTSFETSLGDVLKCEIYLFDPEKNTMDLEVEELPSNIHFYPRGLLKSDEVHIGIVDQRKEVYSSFSSILRDYGHVGKIIHYLKMDIEGHEWQVLENMMDLGLLDNVMQLAIEIHTDHIQSWPFEKWLPELQKNYKILTRLERLGFLKVSYRENLNAVGFLKIPMEAERRPACGELFYIRDPLTVNE